MRAVWRRRLRLPDLHAAAALGRGSDETSQPRLTLCHGTLVHGDALFQQFSILLARPGRLSPKTHALLAIAGVRFSLVLCTHIGRSGARRPKRLVSQGTRFEAVRT